MCVGLDTTGGGPPINTILATRALRTDVQIVDFDTGVGAGGPAEPALVVAADGTTRRLPAAPGSQLAYGLERRHCAGTFADAAHVPCERSSAPYCDRHSSTWVCARCTGTCLKDEMDCHDDHAIYLAAFAPTTFKVGVTREWRLETRLREQGADRAAHLRTVKNGRIAREIESELATEFTDRVRVPTKIDGLGRTVDEEAWADTLDGFDPIDTYDFDYGLDLPDRPVAETLATGTVRGVKGRVLVLDHADSTYAVDARDLVGYEITEGATDRDLQSSLGAFG
jgi:hypothetical protein